MLTPAQRGFALSAQPFPAFIGGYGSGKTAAAMARALMLKGKFPACDIAYYLPSFPLVQDIAMQRFPELCERRGWPYKLKGGATPEIEFNGQGRILFRSMAMPARIVGYEVAHSIVDELDTLPTDHARAAWNKIIARNRQKMPQPAPIQNSVAVATTPEGFRFVYERWERSPPPGYVAFRARTEDNAANLPPGYIQNMRNSYPPNLLRAYLDGQFVNLTSGSVYADFNRAVAHVPAVAQPGEALHVGMDFNVMNMTAIVSVIRDNLPITVGEITGVADTPAMSALLRQRYDGHSIIVYPDASGASRKSTNAQVSDHALLRQAGFVVRTDPANPAVRDRVNAMNKIIPEWRINTDACPVLVQSIEQQAYDRNGEPSKDGGHDHACDAIGYFICHRWPIVRRRATVTALRI